MDGIIASLQNRKWLQADRTKDALNIEHATEHLHRLMPFGLAASMPVEIRTISIGAYDTLCDGDVITKYEKAVYIGAFDAAVWSAYKAAVRKGDGINAYNSVHRPIYDSVHKGVHSDVYSIAYKNRWIAHPATFAVAYRIAYAAGHVIAHAIAGARVAGRELNPFEPLMAIWLNGFCPVGPVNGTFLIAILEGES